MQNIFENVLLLAVGFAIGALIGGPLVNWLISKFKKD